jgi:uncharacterized damage-inducible protein DinB
VAICHAPGTEFPQQAWFSCISVNRRDWLWHTFFGRPLRAGTGAVAVGGAETFLDNGRLFITNIQKLCCVMASPQQQIRFEHWANSQSLEAIIAASHDLPEALSLVAHIVSISRFWAARVEGTAEKLAPWPTLTAPELEAELRRLRNRWLKLSNCTAMDAQVRYESSDGENRSNVFSEVLQEVFLHGAHHRGQIALVLRMKGFEPPRSTDFIPALRTKALQTRT